MKNQPSPNGGASPELQPIMGLPTNDDSTEGPVADSSTSAATSPPDTLSQEAAPGAIAPDSKKGGQV
jgi:hypothetical protein